MRSEPAELKAQVYKPFLVQAMPPIHVRVEAQAIGRVQKPEQVRSILARALKRKAAIDLVAIVEELVYARLQSVFMGGSHDGNLVVVARAAFEVRKWIEV